MQFKQLNISECSEQNIVLYGYTVGGKATTDYLISKGIVPSCICDKAHGGGLYKNIRILNLTHVLEEIESPVFAIVVTRSMVSVIEELKENGITEVYFLDEIIASEDYVTFVNNMSMLVEEDRIPLCNFVKQYPLYVNNVMSINKTLPVLEVFLTEKCTLRCRDCSHLIYKYTKPCNFNSESIKEQIIRVLDIVGKIEDVVLLGGEPFLYPDLKEILYWLRGNDGVGDITIITNGTLIPKVDVVTAVKDTAARVRISDYGDHSIRRDELFDACKKEGIDCYINREKWTDMGGFENRGYTEETLYHNFNNCPFAFALLLLNNKIFRCAHVGHLHNLGYLDSKGHDYISLELDEKEEYDAWIKNKEKEFEEYMHIPYLFGCNYCNGIDNARTGIEPGTQIDNANASIKV